MREQSFSNPRREEGAELGEVPTRNEGVGKEGRVPLDYPERSEAFQKISINQGVKEFPRHHTKGGIYPYTARLAASRPPLPKR